MGSWPVTLPALLAPGYHITPQGASVADAGPAGTAGRERTASPVDIVAARAIFDHDEMATFEGWHLHLLAAGANWFTIGLQFGSSFADVQARFAGEGTFDARLVSPNVWEVSFELEVRPA